MKYALSFDDVLITPKFSDIESRAKVDLDTTIGNVQLKLPVFSANMDTVTESEMAWAMYKAGGTAVLHRFQTIEENVEMFKKSPETTFCSIGIANQELHRGFTLWNNGCRNFIIDVANAASQKTVEFYRNFLEGIDYKKATVIVGNFATRESVLEFLNKIPFDRYPHALKIGVGGGSVCTTRVVTGCGLPTLQSLLDCRGLNIPLIACGGLKNSGDIAKALSIPNVLGVMLGGMLAGTKQASGAEYLAINGDSTVIYKRFRGSASSESYSKQQKTASHRSPEGKEGWMLSKGCVIDVLQQIEGGLRSAFTYVNANNIQEFQKNVELVQISGSGLKESEPHATLMTL